VKNEPCAIVFAGAACDGTADEGVLVPGSSRSSLCATHPQNSAEIRGA